jgi:hypothetical protein
MDRDDRVLAIEVAGEHRPDFAGLYVGGVRAKAALEIAEHVLPLPGPVEQDHQIVGLAPERVGQAQVILDAAPALRGLLGQRLILPEIRRGGRRLDFAQFALQSRIVKVPSAEQRRGRTDRCRGGRVRRGSWVGCWVLGANC